MNCLSKNISFQAALIACCFVATSSLLTADEAKKKDKPITPKEAMTEALERRVEEGDDAAVAYLTERLRERVDGPGSYYSFYVYIWREAQVRSGRTDQLWASKLNEIAFMVSYQEGFYSEAMQIANNLGSTLTASGRYGRWAEIVAIWKEAQRMGGTRFDLSVYPDLGPALERLPEIRHRDMPATLPYSVERPKGTRIRSLPSRFHVNQAGAFRDYALKQYYAGHWREHLEWNIWVRDWATNMKTGQPIGEKATTWYGTTQAIISALKRMSFHEEALAMTEEALAAPHGKTYHGRFPISLKIGRLRLLRQLDRVPDDLVAQHRDLIEQSVANRHINKSGHWYAKISLVRALFHTGQDEEAEALLDSLIAEGYSSAVWLRLTRRIDAGEVEGIEAALQARLVRYREDGRKISERELYSKYAQFLESQGRYQEALMMRREAVHLSRTFDLFYALPVELSKLAALLHLLNDEAGSAAAAGEARALLTSDRIAPAVRKNARKHLDRLNEVPASAKPLPERRVELQPLQSVVAPIANADWTTYLTLTNPSDQSVQGLLGSTGMPLSLSLDEESGDIVATVNASAEDGADELALSINPGSYRLIRVHGSAVAETPEEDSQAEMRFRWSSSGEDDDADEVVISVQSAQDEVTSGIVQAGSYHANPFYGVRLHHQYITHDDGPNSPPMRFVASQSTRVEIYQLDGTPLAIDGQGNGSLLDRGDELFGFSDGRGNPLLPLTDGTAAFQVILYPDGSLPEEGLMLDIEVFESGEWQIHSRNRLTP